MCKLNLHYKTCSDFIDVSEVNEERNILKPLMVFNNCKVCITVLSLGYNCPDLRYEIMLKTWNEDPKKRPTFETLSKDLQALIAAKQVGFKTNHNYIKHTLSETFRYCLLWESFSFHRDDMYSVHNLILHSILQDF